MFIPAFSNNTISQLNTNAQAVGLSIDSNTMIAFNSCYKKEHIRICNNQLGYFTSECLGNLFSKFNFH